ncbi:MULTISPECIES: NAD(P)/FAD-dependent oxidoreductase [Haloferax]|uniref:Hydrogen cyanide synthase subunit HcnC n=1 Tax=Haloferax massiliensis TaxID=1476858 RepID=A0A0D6JMK6_9EURY|nr:MULTISPECIES: FAD-dependent oxidoreductase [Haloferax]MDS0243463.1 FAD-dependent oxidoreductase [Haloferax sp. S2CR25]MDS0446584.1 FAD-dependent oxidoreductase [Haloferax sp. S2CR25-2]CQR49136.1 Hydrogen cyanide synthase subunit HcnC precursor [Haloferax massiliensis]
MTDRYEAVVVGGGIVGSSVAYHLAREGVETLLVDRADEGRATDAGAGILSPGTTSRDDEMWVEYAVEAVAYYDELVAALERDQDGPHGYAERGVLGVAVDDAEVAAFEETLERVRDRQERFGVPEPGTVRELDPAAANARFPPLADVERAFFSEDAARVDGREFEGALRRAARTHGLVEEAASVERLVVAGDRVESVELESGGRIDADHVVVAGGAWSAAFGSQLGVDVPVEPQRGQIVHLDVEADTDGWPIVSPFRGHYMVPWDDGRVAAGATRETGSGYVPRTTVAGLNEVFEEVLRVAPGLADASLRTARVGLRPLTPDGRPVLGPVPGVAGVSLCTGHGPTGLQLGPYSGKLVADAVRDEAADPALDRFGVTRF